MPRAPKVYTRTGDDGTTSLFSGERVGKGVLRIAAYGTVDELNSYLGVALAGGLADRLAEPLADIQRDLFGLGADLATRESDTDEGGVSRISSEHVERLESLIDDLSAELEPLQRFILPGGSPGAAHLHVARTVCRRAERQVALLAEVEAIGGEALRYLNRLSDALFVMSRYENHRRGVADVVWDGAG